MKKVFISILVIGFALILNYCSDKTSPNDGFEYDISVPDDYPTIQMAIDSASIGDIILVQPGTYVENINFNGKSITVGSLFLTTNDTSYISQTVIDGDSNGCVVTFDNEEDSTVVLSGFTIKNGLGCGLYPNWTGGGITCINYSSPTIDNIIISGNSAICGGGIHCKDNSSPILDNIIISGNSADFCGGGIYCGYNSSPTFCNTTISGNYSENWGGGIYCGYNSSPAFDSIIISGNNVEWGGGGICCWENSNPILVNITINGNDSAERGGGIYCKDNSNPILENITICGNSAGVFGGGIMCEDNSNPILKNIIISVNITKYGGGICCRDYSCPTLENITIISNYANKWGGGIDCENYSCPILKNITITGNSANDGGGIYCRNYSSPSLENVTITGNSANDGGGIYCFYNCNLSLLNSILWNDTPQDIYFNQDYDPNTITISYSDIQGGLNGIETNNNGTVNWLDGNIDEDPLFVDPLNGDYHLQYASPCIDAGNPDPQYNDPDGTRNDMGAYGGPGGDW